MSTHVMEHQPVHIPVMPQEVLDILAPDNGQVRSKYMGENIHFLFYILCRPIGFKVLVL